MKKIILSMILMSSFSLIYAENNLNGIESYNDIECVPELQKCLDAIQKLPEARKLIATVQKEGRIRIAINDIHLPTAFGAFWDLDHRIIFVNVSSNRPMGALIGSIIFELHNALIQSKLNSLDYLAIHGQISRDAYTEAVERLEYQNSLDASALTVRGIQLGIFPKSAFLPTYSTFKEYYEIQQQAGHSAWISKTYDSLTGQKF